MKRIDARIGALLTLIAAAVLVAYFFLYPASKSRTGYGGPVKNKILLIGIDAGSWDIIKGLISQGRLPNMKRLIEEGSAGHLDSFLWRELIHGGKGYFSPIVWASIATGKMPDKHGSEDFTMPLPSVMLARIVPKSAQGYASIKLPDMAPMQTELLCKLRSLGKDRKITVYFNQKMIKEIPAKKSWQRISVILPASAFQVENQLSFYYEAEAQEIGKPIVEFNYLRMYDEFGQEILDIHVMRDKPWFGESWENPDPTEGTMVSSFHLRSKTLWEIFTETQRRVGVVGWWQTWPAFPVNGYLVSTHIGYHGARVKGMGNQWLYRLKDLTYPESYLKEIQSHFFFPESLTPEIRKRFYDIDMCSCVGKTQDQIFRDFYWQDSLFERISMDLLKNKGPFDLFANYFRGVDESGHQFLRFSEKPEEFLPGCTGCDANRLPEIVNKYYEYMDDIVGKMVKYEDKNTVTMIVTDHGQFLQGSKGIHRNNGFIILHGGPVRKHLMRQASVLDITPTVLYLSGLPVGQDMDGSVLVEAFDPEYLQKNPIAYISSYEDHKNQREKKETFDREVNEENMEQLKALGYVDQ